MLGYAFVINSKINIYDLLAYRLNFIEYCTLDRFKKKTKNFNAGIYCMVIILNIDIKVLYSSAILIGITILLIMLIYLTKLFELYTGKFFAVIVYLCI